MQPHNSGKNVHTGLETMKIAIYARVSKALDQNPENQLLELREYAKKAGYEIEGEYIDEISSRDTRPKKEEILKKLRLNLLDGVVFWSLDRWGRNMTELVLELEEFGGKKQVISLKEGIDLTTAAGKLSAHIFAAMANFERERIRERTKLGLARVKAQGKRLGRPPTAYKYDDPSEDDVRKLLGDVLTSQQIAEKLKTSRYRVEKVINNIKKKGGV